MAECAALDLVQLTAVVWRFGGWGLATRWLELLHAAYQWIAMTLTDLSLVVVFKNMYVLAITTRSKVITCLPRGV